MSETSSMQSGISEAATTGASSGGAGSVGSAGESTTRLTGEMDQLKSDFNRLKEDFRKILDDSLSVARAGTGSAKDSLSSQFGSVQDRGQEAVQSVEQMIQDRPLTSLAVAVGVGFLLGKLLD